MSEMDGKTALERAGWYHEEFTTNIEPLRRVSKPKLCEAYPNLASEILMAYFFYTTFTVKVMTNYNANAKRFYIDRRVDNCGKLMLAKHELRRVRALKKRFGFGSVKFDIGTAFQTLFSITVRTVPLPGAERMQLVCYARYPSSAHPALNDFVRSTCKKLDSCWSGSQGGLKLKDLQKLASEFIFQPTPEMWTVKSADYALIRAAARKARQARRRKPVTLNTKACFIDAADDADENPNTVFSPIEWPEKDPDLDQPMF